MANSTVAVGLNKSEAFIKNNATEIHSRDVKFYNNQKLCLDKGNEIPPLGVGYKCYMRCPLISYFENYRMTHHLLQVWTVSGGSTTSTSFTTPEGID